MLVGYKVDMPGGCGPCESLIEWDCHHCFWRDNSWKYDEVNYIYQLANWQAGGLDLNRLPSLQPLDFMKVHALKEYV